MFGRNKREVERLKAERDELKFIVENKNKVIAELRAELEEERYRHDRLQDFEVAEAKELAKVKAELAAAKKRIRLKKV